MLKKLLEDRAATWDKMLAIRGRAEADHRDFTRAERAEWDAGEARVGTLTHEIEKVQKRDAAAKAMPVSAIDFGPGAHAGDFRAGQPLRPEQRVTDWATSRGLVRDSERELDFGKYVRGIATGDWRDAELEQRAMAEGTGSAGGNLVPTFLGAELIDLARNETVCLQAGAQVVPMETSVQNVAKWAGDATVAWRSENAAITPTDSTIGLIQLKAQSLSCLTQVSRELVEDATAGGSVGDAIKAAFAKSFAVKLDYAALYGSGTVPEPRGIKNTSGITTSSMGANGAALTNWDPIVDAVGGLQDNNETPNAIVMAPRSQRSLGKLKDTQNRYLTPPTILDGIGQYVTNQVPINLTQGSSNLASDVIVGDFHQLIIGVRTQLTISVLAERYADAGAIAFLGWYRADVAVARPKAFSVLSGVL